MNYQELLEQVKQNAIRIFKTKGDHKFVYHNLAHTESVVSNAGQIARHYQLGEKDFFIVMTAAWFHDTGYFTGGSQDHELRGAEIVAKILKENQVDDEPIQAIRQCILATRIPQSPNSLPEQIVCDADLFHFGTDDFAGRNKLMRKEAESRLGKKISKSDWRKGTIRILEAHQFQTEYCRNLLQDKKKQNLKDLKQKDAEQAGKTTAATAGIATSAVAPGVQPTVPPVKKQKIDRPERGIETMFRISSSNHQRLSDMADNKAHIMITTTSIIISVLLSVLLRKLEDNPQLIIPTMLLLAVCVVTMVCSILATRPNLPPGTFTQQDIDNRKVNLLFFGNFYRMTFDDFDDGMKKMMNDREFLYGSLTRDVFSQGVVLGKKYRLLRTGYSVFMYGIVASVLAFFVASVFFK
ncbi:MAG: Pycsar system effector family protein [Chitinophagaceae bacterium]